MDFPQLLNESDAGDALVSHHVCAGRLSFEVVELVQEDMHHCLRAWQPHQRERDETFCCLCYHFMVMDYSVHCGFRNASCAPGPAASRAACGWNCAHGAGREEV